MSELNHPRPIAVSFKSDFSVRSLNLTGSRPSGAEKYLYGYCDIFALALNRRFGLDIYALVEDRFVTGQVLKGLVHAVCVPPPPLGEVPVLFDMIIDATGVRPYTDVLCDYNVDAPEIVRCSVDSILVYGEYLTTNRSLLSAELAAAEAYIEEHLDLFQW